MIATLGKFGLIVAAPLAAVALLSAGSAQAQEGNRGEQVMNGACADCHDLRPIATAAMSREEWTGTVEAMVQKGATIKSPEDKDALIDYLASNHPPMPDGRGKDIVLNVCTMCHDTKRIRLGRRSPEEWEETLVAMLNEGAPLSEADFPVVHAYLSRNFGN